MKTLPPHWRGSWQACGHWSVASCGSCRWAASHCSLSTGSDRTRQGHGTFHWHTKKTQSQSMQNGLNHSHWLIRDTCWEKQNLNSCVFLLNDCLGCNQPAPVINNRLQRLVINDNRISNKMRKMIKLYLESHRSVFGSYLYVGMKLSSPSLKSVNAFFVCLWIFN